MRNGWLWAFCPGTFDYTFLCHQLLWYGLVILWSSVQLLRSGEWFGFHVWILPLSTGTANNAGAILVLGRDLVVVPKLIHPLPPAISSPEASPERHIEDTWMQVLHKRALCVGFLSSNVLVVYIIFEFDFYQQELNANRPPTPTRGRPQVANDRGSLAWI